MIRKEPGLRQCWQGGGSEDFLASLLGTRSSDRRSVNRFRAQADQCLTELLRADHADVCPESDEVSGQQEQVQRYARSLADQEAKLAALRDRHSELTKQRSAIEAQLKALIDSTEF